MIRIRIADRGRRVAEIGRLRATETAVAVLLILFVLYVHAGNADGDDGAEEDE